MPGVEPGEVHEVKIETGLGAGGDDQEGDQSQRKGAVPEQAGNNQHEKKVEAVKELFMVGVLHLPHAAKLLHPGLNFEFLLSHNPDPAGFVPSGQPCGFSAQTFWESLF